MPYVLVNPYQTSYLAAKTELEQRKIELARLTNRIAQLEQTIITLEPLANDNSLAPVGGLPEMCRQILRSQPGAGFTATAVMQHLQAMGIDISGYSNPLAMLHTTLTRICKPGNGFVKGQAPDGQPSYCYDERFLSDVYRSGMRGF